MADTLERLINEQVVLDTATPIVYIGKLVEVADRTLVLQEADMHDFRDGHATKEVYLAETLRDGVAMNRREVMVMRSAIISVSRLTDVVAE